MSSIKSSQSQSAKHHSAATPWIVCFAASLFFFYVFIQLNMFNVLAPALYKTFHINSEQMAHLSIYYFYGNVLLLFPAGILLDRFSVRLITILAMGFAIIGTFIFATSTSLQLDDICRFIIGAAGAFCLLAPVRIASRWFPPTKMALVVGLIVTFAMLGGMVAQAPFGYFIKHFGWRHTLVGDGVLGILLLFLILFYVKDAPPSYSNESHSTDNPHKSDLGFWHMILLTLKNSQNWLAGLYASLLNLPVFLLGGLWGALYLEQTHHFNLATASSIPMFIFIGMIIGSPAFGWFSDKIVNRKMPMIVGAILSLITILAIMYIPHLHYMSLVILFFIYGFMISSQIIAYPVVAESNPLRLTGTAEGIASFLIMSGGFAHILFSQLLNWHWNHQIVNNIPIYSNINYQHAMFIMPAACILALILSFMIKETRCKNISHL